MQKNLPFKICIFAFKIIFVLCLFLCKMQWQHRSRNSFPLVVLVSISHLENCFIALGPKALAAAPTMCIFTPPFVCMYIVMRFPLLEIDHGLHFSLSVSPQMLVGPLLFITCFNLQLWLNKRDYLMRFKVWIAIHQ